ncbi:CesT family type III secretion system chaperone [Bordetella genomosp. 13]|uniref:CesT family type III secretion system chaperone n=1 Tax=Bordetella genomosp. 13 TaxID=463040 RepID=UPI0011A7E6F4|nr:CesT family type III secretion system chaperone [Bordetella genomosp. 13]
MSATSHPLIARYLARHAIPEALRSDGRATLTIDDKYRVHLQGTRNGWLAICARLCALPPAGIAREDFVAGLARQAAGMLSGHASACVVDPAEEALWLQQMVRPDSSEVEMDEAVGQFANALSFWTGAVKRAA